MTSTSSRSFSNSLRPASVFRSRSAACLPMLPSTWKKGTSERLGLVIFKTSAPYSARIRVIVGPAMIRHISSTLTPLRIFLLSLGAFGNGVGGRLPGRRLTFHAGSWTLSFPYMIISALILEFTYSQTYMGCLDKVFVFVGSYTSLASFLVHRLKLRGCVFLHLFLNDLDDLFVVSQIWPLAFESNHIQSGRSLQRSMNVEELFWVLSLVQISRHAAVAVRLCRQQIGVYLQLTSDTPRE